LKELTLFTVELEDAVLLYPLITKVLALIEGVVSLLGILVLISIFEDETKLVRFFLLAV
jgi:hypothetical protein